MRISKTQMVLRIYDTMKPLVLSKHIYAEIEKNKVGNSCKNFKEIQMRIAFYTYFNSKGQKWSHKNRNKNLGKRGWHHNKF